MNRAALLLAAFALASCDGCDRVDPSNAVPAALHRLTEHQLNNALGALFADDQLPRVQLPVEVRVYGFDNNALTRAPTPAYAEALQLGLSAVARAAVAREGPWLGCSLEDGDRACGHETLAELLPRAWRRPVTEEEQAWLQGHFDDWLDELEFSGALQLGVELALLSPDFLFLLERGGQPFGSRPLDDHEVASRLSFLLWDSMPDAALFEAAEAGRLSTRGGVRAEAERLLDDERGLQALVRFHQQWLDLDALTQSAPDVATFGPALDPEAYALYVDWIEGEEAGNEVTSVTGLAPWRLRWGITQQFLQLHYRQEFDAFVAHAIESPASLQTLLTSPEAFVSPLTARVYDVEVAPQGDALTQVTLDARERPGIFTRGAFLAAHAHPTYGSPVLRGVSLRERLLCAPLPPPPAGTPPIEITEAETWSTNRERYEALTEPEGCIECHAEINGTGFPFESFDAVGAFRTEDTTFEAAGVAVDSTGSLLGTDVDGPVDDVAALMSALAGSARVHDCAVTNLYRYAFHRGEAVEDEAALQALQTRFFDEGGSVRALVLDLVTSDAFLTRLEDSP